MRLRRARANGSACGKEREVAGPPRSGVVAAIDGEVDRRGIRNMKNDVVINNLKFGQVHRFEFIDLGGDAFPGSVTRPNYTVVVNDLLWCEVLGIEEGNFASGRIYDRGGRRGTRDRRGGPGIFFLVRGHGNGFPRVWRHFDCHLMGRGVVFPTHVAMRARMGHPLS